MKRTSKKAMRQAQKILQSPDFFGELRAILRRAGLVGEERNALTTYIVASSRLLDEPVNLLIKGPSSAGKNFLARTVLSLFPKREIKSLTSSSNRAWNYLGNRLRNKVVFIEERNRDMGPVHPARLLVSEKKLIHTVTVGSAIGGRTVERVTEGPIACISTTTRNRLEVDDETRNLSSWADASEAQTRRIMRQALDGFSELSGSEKDAWQAVQVLLARRARRPVRFPKWFAALVECAEAGDVRVRRYFQAFLQACRTVCLIRSFRKNPALRKQDLLTVSFTDFATTALIFDSVLAESLSRGEGEADETRQHVAAMVEQQGRAVGVTELADYLGVKPDKAYALLRSAKRVGTIIRANRPARGNRKLYRPAPAQRFLPDPEEFFMATDGLPRRVAFTHPLSGERLVYERRGWREEED